MLQYLLVCLERKFSIKLDIISMVYYVAHVYIILSTCKHISENDI